MNKSNNKKEEYMIVKQYTGKDDRRKPTGVWDLFKNVRAVWLMFGAFISGVTVVLSSLAIAGEKTIDTLYRDTVSNLDSLWAETLREERKAADSSILIDAKEKRIELYQIMGEAFPEFREAAMKKKRLRQASEELEEAIQ